MLGGYEGGVRILFAENKWRWIDGDTKFFVRETVHDVSRYFLY